MSDVERVRELMMASEKPRRPINRALDEAIRKVSKETGRDWRNVLTNYRREYPLRRSVR